MTRTASNTPRFVEKTPEVPAPNTYTIQLNTTNRTPAGRDSPFGTSGRRFEQTMFKSTNARLGPGSYKSDVVTSMAYQTHKRVATCSPASRSFGMAGERFPYRLNKTPQTPGRWIVETCVIIILLHYIVAYAY